MPNQENPSFVRGDHSGSGLAGGRVAESDLVKSVQNAQDRRSPDELRASGKEVTVHHQTHVNGAGIGNT